MEVRNFVGKEIFSAGCCGQKQNNNGRESTEHLRNRRRVLGRFRFSRHDRGQRNPQFATDRLTSLDLGQALAHFFFERDRILRPIVRIFAQEINEQIVQRLRRAA